MNDTFHHRRRWPRILLLGAVLLVLGVVVGFWIWSTGAGRRLDREVARLKAAGEPMEISDFATTGVVDADNAAIDLREAALSIDSTTDHYKQYQKIEPAIPLTDYEKKSIAQIVADNPEAFAGMERALTKKAVDWQIVFKSPAIQVMLPDLSRMRELANLIGNRAMLEHQQGDDAAALRDLDHLFFIANATDRQPVLVSHLVAIGIRGIVTQKLDQMTPGLKIGDQPQAASREQIQSLINKLLDDKSETAAMHRALQGERAVELDAARCLSDGRLSLSSIAAPSAVTASASAANAAVAILGRPMFLTDALLVIRQTTGVLGAFDKTNTRPAFVASAPPMPAELLNGPLTHVLARMLMASFDRAVLNEYRNRVDRRMSAVALAVACYRSDHDGKYPKSLSELVPNYLPAIPGDPLSASGPIKYRAATTQPIVYSVGDDGIDNGGSEINVRKRSMPSKWELQDAVTHLTLQKRPEPAPEDSPDTDTESPAPTTMPATTMSATTAPATTAPSMTSVATQPATNPS